MTEWSTEDPRSALVETGLAPIVIRTPTGEFIRGDVITHDESWTVWVKPNSLHFAHILAGDSWPSDWAWVRVPYWSRYA